ncbi:MAG: hypothetical protein RI972_572 [Pseudomonadota bacterium]|jgi:hypothetical protein
MQLSAFIMSTEHLKSHLATLCNAIADRPLDRTLEDWLNAHHGVGSPAYEAIKAECVAGAEAGWLCGREAGGIRFSRPFKPSDELHGFSVDVVDMHDIAGPHHRHPHGEIDLIMPLDDGATFDHHGAGWLVCPPGTAHRPTVRNGRALVLYLLPDGAIEFSG